MAAVSMPDGGLFQSQEWQGFQRFQGRSVWNIKEDIYGTEKKLSFYLGKYAYTPRFPGLSYNEEYENLLSYADTKNWVFIRVEPQSTELLQELQAKIRYKITEAPNDVQPREILMLDIDKNEEDLLKIMKSKARYNIRLASKHGIVVKMTREEKDREAFLDIMEKTAKRKSIHFHPRSYYRSFLEYFPKEQCELFVAKKDGIVLSGSLVYFYKQTAYYLHGGSGDTGRHLMAPYLLQWTQILEAQKRGCTQYDFGGVAVKGQVRTGKDWSGITRFKQGFGPSTETLLFPGTYDIVLNKKKYFLYRMLHLIKSRIL